MTASTSSSNSARRLHSSGRRLAGAAASALVVAGAISVGVAATSAPSPSPDAVAPTIVVSDGACAPGWVAPSSGRTVFEVDNDTNDQIYGIDLVGSNQITVYGEIEMLAPRTTVPLDAILPPGDYSFICESFDGAVVRSQVEQVSGPAVHDAHPYTPTDQGAIQAATVDYRDSLTPIMEHLTAATDRLLADIDAGRLATARLAWLSAHLDYERLGAAYDTFGNFNDLINGRPLGLVGGVHSQQWHGFFRLEYGLWHRQPASELRAVARALDVAVHGLLQQFPLMLTPFNDLSLRTHEILENTLQFVLSGETDEGSNTDLATAWANVQGTELALHALVPILRRTAPADLAPTSSGLIRLAALFKSYRHRDGSWAALDSLTQSAREHIDGQLGALLEQLSLIPDLLDLPIRPPADTDSD